MLFRSSICPLVGLLVIAASATAQEISPQAFANISQGLVADAGIGTTPVGDTLMGELGARSVGIKTLGARRWLLQWDALVAIKGGWLANQQPFLPLVGGHGYGCGELGYRFMSQSRWSPYVGGRLAGNVQVMTRPGVPIGDLDRFNSVDGVGGLVLSGSARLDIGASYLGVHKSWLLAAFVQEELNAREINTAGAAFTEVGLSARYDLARSLSLILEGAWGRTPNMSSAALATSNQTTHQAVSLDFRKIFSNSMWISIAAGIARDLDHRTYAGSPLAYDTASPPTFGFTLLYGLPLGRQE